MVRQDELLAVADMPTREKPGESLIRREIDGRALYELILKLVDVGGSDEKITVWLENVYGMRKGRDEAPQGSASVFSFGDTRGSIRTVIEVLCLRPQWVAPQSWKRWFKLSPDKNAARLKALQFYPQADLQRVKDHNRAEAILIARYGYDRLVGPLFYETTATQEAA